MCFLLLSKPYMNDAMWRPQSSASLRDKGWRIEQVSIIDSYRTDGRVKTQPKPDGVGHVFKTDITDGKEHIADVVKGDQAHSSSDRIAEFEIEDGQRIAAAGDQSGQFTLADSLKNDLRPGLLEAESAERGCAARKKSFADRQ